MALIPLPQTFVFVAVFVVWSIRRQTPVLKVVSGLAGR